MTQLPDTKSKSQIIFVATIAVILIVGGIYYLAKGPALEFPPDAISIDGQPVETIELADVTGKDAIGKAVRYTKDGKYFHELVADLDELKEGHHYEGWLFDGLNRRVSTGTLTLLSEPIYTLNFSSDEDLSDYLKVIITLQPDFVTDPDLVLLEGFFKE